MTKTNMLTIDQAKKLKLIQLTVWLNEKELEWLRNEKKRIENNPKRTVALVMKNDWQFALWCDDIAAREAKERREK